MLAHPPIPYEGGKSLQVQRKARTGKYPAEQGLVILSEAQDLSDARTCRIVPSIPLHEQLRFVKLKRFEDRHPESRAKQ